MKSFALALVIAVEAITLGTGDVRAEPTYEDLVGALREKGMGNSCDKNNPIFPQYTLYEDAPGGYYRVVYYPSDRCKGGGLGRLDFIQLYTVSDQFFCEPHESNSWSCIVITEMRNLKGTTSTPSPKGGWNSIPRKLTLDQFKALVALEPRQSFQDTLFIPKTP